MEAKDTILGVAQDAIWDFEKFKLDQAEVSFRAGIKEVVEWIKEHSNDDDEYNIGGKVFFLNDWQAQLKEWGLQENK